MSVAPASRPWHRGYLADALLLLILAGLGVRIGTDYVAADSSPPRPTFFQGEFAPAVLETCGRGFQNPAEMTPPLAKFLAMERTTFDCRDLAQNKAGSPPDALQVSSRYMMWIVGRYWRLTGISWDHLAPLFGVMQAIIVVFAYLTFRAVAGRALAVLLTLALAFSPLQLSMLPYLRDSSKAPCFVATALVLVLLWTRPLTTRLIVLLGGAFGLIAGFGLGFRPDLVMWTPALAIGLFCASQQSVWRRVTATMLGLSVAAVALIVSGWPMLALYQSGSNMGHVAILGFTESFDKNLEVRSAPYTLGHRYDDFYVFAAVHSYAKRVHGYPGVMDLTTRVYERYAVRYYWDVVRTFPADAAARVVASVVKVVNLPFRTDGYESTYVVNRVPYLEAGMDLRNAIFWRMEGWGPVFVLALFALLAVRGYAAAAGFAATVLFLAGLPVLQFQLRHYFHLELIGLVAFGVVAQTVADRIAAAVLAAQATLTRRNRTAPAWMPVGRAAVRRVAVCVGVLILVPIASLAALRSRQQAAVTRLIDTYNLAAEAWPYSARPEDPDHVLVVPEASDIRDRPHPPGQRALAADYLVVDLSDACGALSLTMRLKYASGTGPSDLTRDAVVKLWPAGEYSKVRVFVPVYQSLDAPPNPAPEIRFVGLEFAARDFSCLAGVGRVPESAIAPLWLDLVLNRNWTKEPLYQTLERETVPDDPALGVYLVPPELDVRFVDAVRGVPREITSSSRIAKVDDSAGLIVDGVAESPYQYLVQAPPKPLTAGTRLVAVGDLEAGGFTFGLLNNGAWTHYFNVTRPGPFVTAMTVPDDGDYVLVIANINHDSTKPTRFVIKGLAWIAP